MTALFLVRDDEAQFAQEAIDSARAEYCGHGFASMAECRLPGWRMLYASYVHGGPENFLAQGDDFIAFAGTFSWDGKIGRPALDAALASLDPLRLDWGRIGGQFTMVIRKQARAYLFTDWFAAFQMFHDVEKRFFSSSLLAALGAMPKVSFDTQGVYELAFNVVPVGDDTIFKEIKALGPFALIELGRDGAVVRQLEKPMPEAFDHASPQERIATQRALLSRVIEPWADHFGNDVFCPLSGGLDSRLVLALLREQGCRPSLYVYGAPEDCDVRIAKHIGEALGDEVDELDKETFRDIRLDAFADEVARNFHDHDGLPNFGVIFENGADAFARDKRHEGGALSVSGGCGEVFRNFFFMPRRSYRAADIARSFFARYTLGDVTELFDETDFLRRIEDKILEALGREGERGRLPRAALERVYPAIRCRSLFGREISLEARYGAYLMPFLEHSVVADTLTLPMAQKNAGRFEASLLAAIDPQLAAFQSCYGHDFTGPPGFRHRLGEWATRRRPMKLRQKSYAIQRRFRPMGDEHGGLLTDDYLSRVIDLDYPVMRRFFRIENIDDSAIMRRIANLEYFAERLGSKLAA